MGEVTSFDINGLSKKIDAAQNAIIDTQKAVNTVGQQVSAVQKDVLKVNTDLEVLQKQFLKFVEQQMMENAMQQAQTELIRVRQELEQNFGGYKVVRDTMVGILQATDSKLVKQNTISRVSEELMIQTPNYWLAPCLVAVSAWIGNDRELAERAIKEAVKRDEERTALTMALICRRNGRTETCYEWLAVYFSKQKASAFTEGTYTFLDAYINGVFGPDTKHVCDDYIDKWVSEIKRSDVNFEATQTQKWDDYCDSAYFSSVAVEYPDLAEVPEFKSIDSYLGRVESVGSIRESFRAMTEVDVDRNSLAEVIDSELTKLIKRYDREETPLREEEEYYRAVIASHGDEEAAKEYLAKQRARRQEHTINLLDQMGNAIISDENTSVSKRKTAISFLGSYINKGFDKYVVDNKEAFPDTITLKVDDYTTKVGTTFDCPKIMKEYEMVENTERNKQIANSTSKKATIMWVLAAICAVLTVVGFVAGGVLGVVFAVITVICAVSAIKTKKNTQSTIDNLNKMYDEKIAAGKNKIATTLTEWQKALSVVSEFEGNECAKLVS